MPDYTLCPNTDCKARFMCQRYTRENIPNQSYNWFKPSENNCDGWMNEERSFNDFVLLKCRKCGKEGNILKVLPSNFELKPCVRTQPMYFGTSGICKGSYELIKEIEDGN